MSERFSNTTWRALDADLLDRLRAARHDVGALEPLMAALPPAPDANPEHCEAVWARDVPPILRPHLLRHFIRAAPARWAPLLDQAVVEQDDEFAEDCFHELATAFELYCVPDGWGWVVYTCPSFARRHFALQPQPFPGAGAILEAFGGEPDSEAVSMAYALRDALIPPARVVALAERLEVPGALPPLVDVPPEAERVWRFEADPEHLIAVLGHIAAFFERAAAAGLPVQVHWHPNP